MSLESNINKLIRKLEIERAVQHTNLDGAAAFERNVDLGRFLSLSSNFAGRVSVFLSVDNSKKLLLELEVNVHVARGAVERSIRPAELDTGGNGV